MYGMQDSHSKTFQKQRILTHLAKNFRRMKWEHKKILPADQQPPSA